MAIHVVPSLSRQVSLSFLTYSYNLGSSPCPPPHATRGPQTWRPSSRAAGLRPGVKGSAVGHLGNGQSCWTAPGSDTGLAAECWQSRVEEEEDTASMGLTSARRPLPAGPTLTSSQCGGVVPCCLRSESRSQRGQGSAEACELLQGRGAEGVS